MWTKFQPVLGLFLFVASMASSLHAADVVTVDGPGVVTVSGVDPATAPASDQVRIGGGQIRIGQAGPAVGDQAVRGDDQRLFNPREANGGNADTVDGKNAADFVTVTDKGAANGVATLDAQGLVPVNQLPPSVGGTKGVAAFKASGTFVVPEGVTSVIAEVWGAGGNGGNGTGGGGGGYALGVVPVSAGQVITVTINSSSSFGGHVVASGGSGSAPGSGTTGTLLLTGASGADDMGGAASRGGGGGGRQRSGAVPGGGGGPAGKNSRNQWVGAGAGGGGLILVWW